MERFDGETIVNSARLCLSREIKEAEKGCTTCKKRKAVSCFEPTRRTCKVRAIMGKDCEIGFVYRDA